MAGFRAWDLVKAMVTMMTGRVAPDAVRGIEIVSPSRTITSANVAALSVYLARVYRAEYRTKATALEMVGASALLDALGILDATAFLRDYTTTIGRVVYLPFVPGEASEKFSLWGQVKILTHEMQHIVQLDRDGAVLFGTRYLGDRDCRAEYEAEAYATAYELERWAGLPLSQPEYLAQKLSAYGLNREQIDYAAGMLRSYRTTVETGGRLLDAHAASTTIEWLNANV